MDCNKFKIYTENVNGDKTSVSFDKLGLTPSTIYWPRLCYGDNTFEFNHPIVLIQKNRPEYQQ